MAKTLNTEKPVFKIEKKHAWRDRLINIVELSLLALVVIGTVVWVLLSSNFSPTNLINNLSETIKPKVSTQSSNQKSTVEDEIRKLFKESIILEIDQVVRTEEGDYEIKCKQGQIVYFSKEKSIGEQVSTLQTLLAKAKIEGKNLKKADFRFAKIVVEY
jgi:hypothetical protein